MLPVQLSGSIVLNAGDGRMLLQPVLDNARESGRLSIITYSLPRADDPLWKELWTLPAKVDLITNIPRWWPDLWGARAERDAKTQIEQYVRSAAPFLRYGGDVQFNLRSHAKLTASRDVAFIGSANLGSDLLEAGVLVSGFNIDRAVLGPVRSALLGAGVRDSYDGVSSVATQLEGELRKFLMPIAAYRRCDTVPELEPRYDVMHEAPLSVEALHNLQTTLEETAFGLRETDAQMGSGQDVVLGAVEVFGEAAHAVLQTARGIATHGAFSFAKRVRSLNAWDPLRFDDPESSDPYALSSIQAHEELTDLAAEADPAWRQLYGGLCRLIVALRLVVATR